MAITYLPAQGRVVLTAADTVLTYVPPVGGTAREGWTVTDALGNVGTIVVLGGVPLVVQLSSALALSGGLVSAGGSANVTPAGTLSVTVTRGGVAVPLAILAVAFAFATTEFPTFGVPSAGTLLGGALGLVPSGTLLVQTNASGVFTATVTMPTALARTVTPVAFRTLAFGAPSNVINNSAVVLGGP